MNVTVIGAGLAGSECAWQLAQRGIQVELHEMKPEKMTPAHTTEYFAELCCSNSLRGAGLENAVGLLKEELRRLDSLILQCADATRVEAGGALAVDRHGFARLVTEKIRSHPNITVVPGEVTEIPEGEVIIASGPLTSDALAETLQGLLGEHSDLHFFDAAAPLVSAESVDMDYAWMGSRYDKGTDDYVNCPMNQEEYDAFWKELTTAQEAEVHGFEDSQVFEGCMPVEVMARRGHDTLLYGPLKSRGLDDPRTGRWPYAVVQLRRDNADGTVYNLVGFQTHLKFPEQRRVFSMIPALRNAEFLRYGVMHRNTFLDSPRLLDRYYRLKKEPRIAFAGQMTGVEGYVESAASGFLVGIETARRLKGQPPVDFPREMAIGALLAGATLLVKRIRGVRRAAMGPVLPTATGRALLCDCGANADCTPEYLLQFAYLGNFYAQRLMGVEKPRVGLLNIGSEPSKGDTLRHETYALLEEAGREGRLNFIGNIEANTALLGGADVIVADGYSGNILLKTVEGAAKLLLGEMKKAFLSSTKSKLGALLVKDSLGDVKKLLDPSEVGGTPFLGISKPVLKAHGSSDARAIRNAVFRAVEYAQSGIIADVEAHIDVMKVEKNG